MVSHFIPILNNLLLHKHVIIIGVNFLIFSSAYESVTGIVVFTAKKIIVCLLNLVLQLVLDHIILWDEARILNYKHISTHKFFIWALRLKPDARNSTFFWVVLQAIHCSSKCGLSFHCILWVCSIQWVSQIRFTLFRFDRAGKSAIICFDKSDWPITITSTYVGATIIIL